MKRSGPIGHHIVFRARFPHRPFLDRDFNVKVWLKLKELFEDSAATLLMPNHFHLLALGLPPDEVLKRMLHLHSVLSRWSGRGIYETVPPLEPIRDVHHLRRQVRYVHLNPCRKDLCSDPLEWEWSTHLDYIGAAAHPWIQAGRLLRLLKFIEGDAGIQAFHRYVSSDPSVAVRGTSPPRIGNAPLYLDAHVARAAAATALRVSTSVFDSKSEERGLLLSTLAHRFPASKVAVASYFGVSRAAVGYGVRDLAAEERLAKAMRVLLCDARLSNLLRPQLLQRPLNPS